MTMWKTDLRTSNRWMNHVSIWFWKQADYQSPRLQSSLKLHCCSHWKRTKKHLLVNDGGNLHMEAFCGKGHLAYCLQIDSAWIAHVYQSQTRFSSCVSHPLCSVTVYFNQCSVKLWKVALNVHVFVFPWLVLSESETSCFSGWRFHFNINF